MKIDESLNNSIQYLPEIAPLKISECQLGSAVTVKVTAGVSSIEDVFYPDSHCEIFVDIKSFLESVFTFDDSYITDGFSERTSYKTEVQWGSSVSASISVSVAGSSSAPLKSSFTVVAYSSELEFRWTDLGDLVVPRDYVLPVSFGKSVLKDRNVKIKLGVSGTTPASQTLTLGPYANTGNCNLTFLGDLKLMGLVDSGSVSMGVFVGEGVNEIAGPKYTFSDNSFEQYLFFNKYGGVDNIPFSGARKYVPERDYESGTIKGSRETLSVSGKEIYSQNTGYLSKTNLKVFSELLKSPYIYHKVGYKFKRIIITASTVEISSESTVFSAMFNYRYCDEEASLSVMSAPAPAAVSTEKSSDTISFTNPVLNDYCPDPCFWKGDNGYFYVKSSGIRRPVFRTRDFVHYEDTGDTFISTEALTWLKSTFGHAASDDETYIIPPNVNAPCVVRIGGKWLMYLAIEEMEGTKASNSEKSGGAHIVVLSSRTPYGKFGDPRIVVSDNTVKISAASSTKWGNVIDPFVYCDPLDNRIYLIAGSSKAIRRVQLTDDGLAVASGTYAKHVAGNTTTTDPTRVKVFEGSYLYNRTFGGNTYWYLFVSAGKWTGRDYCVKVGRRASGTTIPGTDPATSFVDDSGANMRNGGGKTVLASNPDSDSVWGPGHIGGIFETADGRTWILYHCHTANGASYDRKLFVQELKWDEDGWPFVVDESNTKGYPALSGEMSAQVISGTAEVGGAASNGSSVYPYRLELAGNRNDVCTVNLNVIGSPSAGVNSLTGGSSSDSASPAGSSTDGFSTGSPSIERDLKIFLLRNLPMKKCFKRNSVTHAIEAEHITSGWRHPKNGQQHSATKVAMVTEWPLDSAEWSKPSSDVFWQFLTNSAINGYKTVQTGASGTNVQMGMGCRIKGFGFAVYRGSVRVSEILPVDITLTCHTASENTRDRDIRVYPSR